MSLQVHSRDNISVKAHFYKYTVNEGKKSESIDDVFHLDFTFLINGKIKSYGWSFIINQDKEDYGVLLDGQWNAIQILITQLGYDIGDANIITQWIYDTIEIS